MIQTCLEASSMKTYFAPLAMFFWTSAEEAPVFLFVFLVPSAVALLFWWKMH